ncbi:MAG: TIM-barrel fold metal-dependent hydrolase, partial [Hyphomicrobiales bacterium]|nr:TIM-barrel fold metal-dependent hydrolase [Hyphomicrobiales bacterium]
MSLNAGEMLVWANQPIQHVYFLESGLASVVMSAGSKHPEIAMFGREGMAGHCVLLGADGICMMTSYGSKYIGDRSFLPVMAELNRRKAVVFTHPVKADCCRNLVPDVTENTIELATDTARAIASLLFSGVLSSYPEIRFIFSHAGGTLPSLTGRIIAQAKSSEELTRRLPAGPEFELRKLFYDTANAA